MRNFNFSLVVILIGALYIGGCSSVPNNALLLSPESIAKRKLQTKRVYAVSESHAVPIAVGVLQDMGFTITEASYDLGVIVGEKQRIRSGSALKPLGYMLAGGALGYVLKKQGVFGYEQTVFATLVARKVLDDSGVARDEFFDFRINFSREVRDSDGGLLKREVLDAPELYKIFYERLSSSVVLRDVDL